MPLHPQNRTQKKWCATCRAAAVAVPAASLPQACRLPIGGCLHARRTGSSPGCQARAPDAPGLAAATPPPPPANNNNTSRLRVHARARTASLVRCTRHPVLGACQGAARARAHLMVVCGEELSRPCLLWGLVGMSPPSLSVWGAASSCMRPLTRPILPLVQVVTLDRRRLMATGGLAHTAVGLLCGVHAAAAGGQRRHRRARDCMGVRHDTPGFSRQPRASAAGRACQLRRSSSLPDHQQGSECTVLRSAVGHAPAPRRWGVNSSTKLPIKGRHRFLLRRRRSRRRDAQLPGSTDSE